MELIKSLSPVFLSAFLVFSTLSTRLKIMYVSDTIFTEHLKAISA